jgi:hypothetical protein
MILQCCKQHLRERERRWPMTHVPNPQCIIFMHYSPPNWSSHPPRPQAPGPAQPSAFRYVLVIQVRNLKTGSYHHSPETTPSILTYKVGKVKRSTLMTPILVKPFYYFLGGWSTNLHNCHKSAQTVMRGLHPQLSNGLSSGTQNFCMSLDNLADIFGLIRVRIRVV